MTYYCIKITHTIKKGEASRTALDEIIMPMEQMEQ